MDGADDATQPVDSVSRLPLVLMGAVAALAVLLVVAFGLRGPDTFEPGTPEAAVQDFLQAALDGDADAVVASLTPAAAQRCDDLRSDEFWRGSDTGFELDALSVSGDTARAEVTQRTSSRDDPFRGTWRNGGHVIELRRVDGEWKVERASWPWPVRNCGGAP